MEGSMNVSRRNAVRLAMLGGAVTAASSRGSTAFAQVDPGGNPPAQVVLNYTHMLQSYEWDCGPTSGQMVLSNWGLFPSKAEMINRMHTNNPAGTDNITLVANALNYEIKSSFYRTVLISGSLATSAQKATLKSDLVEDVGKFGRGFVANVLGTATDTYARPHSYTGGHYVAVMGYSQSGALAWIGDPAFGGYWMATDQLADWIAEKGYCI
jgi:hypothetical protein